MPSKSITSKAFLLENVFIDANVIAKWIALHHLASSKKTNREKREFALQQKNSKDKQRKQMYVCYDFIEKIINSKIKKYKFMCSPLTLTEVLSVLFEQHVYGYMQRNYVPFDEFHTQRKVSFGDGTFDEIYSKHSKYFDKIKDKIEITIEDRDNIFGFAGVFISEYGLLSQDAHLMAHAVYNKCKYFVTTDGDLLRKFTKENQAQKENIQYPVAVHPTNFVI